MSRVCGTSHEAQNRVTQFVDLPPGPKIVSRYFVDYHPWQNGAGTPIYAHIRAVKSCHAISWTPPGAQNRDTQLVDLPDGLKSCHAFVGPPPMANGRWNVYICAYRSYPNPVTRLWDLLGSTKSCHAIRGLSDVSKSRHAFRGPPALRKWC